MVRPPVVNPLAPWHMWGASQSITARYVVAGGGGAARATTQLLRVNYKRPETWTLFFGARILRADPQVHANGMNLWLFTDVIFGVGRAVFDTKQPEDAAAGGFPTTTGQFGQSFCTFHWTVGAVLYNYIQLPKKWKQYGDSPWPNEANMVDPAVDRPLVQNLPAQDLQVQTKMILTSTAADFEVEMEMTAFAAPKVHMRPDWFEGEYPGGERGGT